MRQSRENEGIPAAPTGKRVKVRPQALGDVPDVLGVRARSWRAAYTGLVPAKYLLAMEPTPDAIARGEERFRDLGEHVRCFVAEADEGIRGFAVAGPDRDAEPPGGEIWAIYVDPDSWGSGIGRALLSTAAQELIDSGHTPISLWVLEGNASARGFYEHLGFAPSGERRYIELGASIPEVRYVLHADGGQ